MDSISRLTGREQMVFSMYTFGKYVLYFLIYSALGALIETAYRLVTEQQLYGINGFLHLPIFPIFGFGALLIIILLGSRIRNPIVLFTVGALLATLVEFVGHWLIEVVFGDRIWNYSADSLNLFGRVSLYSSIGFGVAAVVLVYILHPRVVALTDRIPKRRTIAIAGVVLAVLLTDFVISAIARL